MSPTRFSTCADTQGAASDFILGRGERLYISTIIPARGSNVPPLSASFSAITRRSRMREERALLSRFVVLGDESALDNVGFSGAF